MLMCECGSNTFYYGINYIQCRKCGYVTHRHNNVQTNIFFNNGELLKQINNLKKQVYTLEREVKTIYK
jgi:hypothetical protein